MSHFARIQKDARNHLIEDPFFAAMQEQIIEQDEGDIVTKINSSLANLGVSILLLHGFGEITNGNLPTPYFSKIKMNVQVAENVLLNRSKTKHKTAMQVIERAIIDLHHKTVGGDANALILAKGFSIITPPKGATLAYQASFELSQGIKLTLP